MEEPHSAEIAGGSPASDLQMSSSDCGKDPRSDSLLTQPLSANSYGVLNLCTALSTQAPSWQSNSSVPEHASTISGVRGVVFGSIQPFQTEQSQPETELLSELSQQGQAVSGTALDRVLASAASGAASGDSIRLSCDAAAVEPLSTTECSKSMSLIQPWTNELASLHGSSNSEQKEAASASTVPKIMIDGVLQSDDVAIEDAVQKVNYPENQPLPVCVQVQLVLLGVLHIVSMVSVAVLDFWASSLKAWMAKKTFSFIISLPSFGMAGLFSIFIVCCKRKAVGVLLCFTVAALLAAVAVCGLAAGGL